jgi:uncharacterized repeat protein (TIGR03806 family)
LVVLKFAMKKIYLLTLLISGIVIFSCSDNDSDYEDILPIATNDIANYEILSPVTVDVLLNDTTGDATIPSTVSLVGGIDTDANQSLDKLTILNEGIWSVNPTTGAITFTPNDTFGGIPSVIKYTVKDAQGNSSNEATITLIPVSTVTANLDDVPFQKLSDYKFFAGLLKNQIPSLNVLPFEPESSLFTDYALKKRFVWMPPGVKATYNGDDKVLELPVGAVLIKNFYYNNVAPSNSTRIIETRLMIKKESGWIFAEYVWNDEQTEAFYDMDGSTTSVTWSENGTTKTASNYRIPSETECFVCHKINNVTAPIGIKPQSLNNNFNFSTGNQNQLEKWIEVGYLENNLPGIIASTVDYKDTSKPLVDRVRSYLDINCAHCHSAVGHCEYRPLRLSFADTGNSSNGQTNMGVCVETEDMQGFPSSLNTLVNPGNSARSMLFYRLNTNNPTYRMPLHGRSIIHDEGVALIEEWINSLTDCP